MAPRIEIDRNWAIFFVGTLFFLSALPLAFSRLQECPVKSNLSDVEMEEPSNGSDVVSGMLADLEVTLNLDSTASGCSLKKFYSGCMQFAGRNLIFMLIVYIFLVCFAFAVLDMWRPLGVKKNGHEATQIETMGMFAFFYPLVLTFLFIMYVIFRSADCFENISFYYKGYKFLILFGFLTFAVLFFIFYLNNKDDDDCHHLETTPGKLQKKVPEISQQNELHQKKKEANDKVVKSPYKNVKHEKDLKLEREEKKKAEEQRKVLLEKSIKKQSFNQSKKQFRPSVKVEPENHVKTQAVKTQVTHQTIKQNNKPQQPPQQPSRQPPRQPPQQQKTGVIPTKQTNKVKEIKVATADPTKQTNKFKEIKVATTDQAKMKKTTADAVVQKSTRVLKSAGRSGASIF